MALFSSMPQMRRVSFLAAAAIFAAASVGAQSTPSPNEPSSSSLQFVADDDLGGATALRTAAAALGSGAGGGQQERGWKHGLANSFALEFGGGFNAPTSDSSPYITWGGNFTGGAGLHFSKVFSLLAEYQFMDDKLPGALIAETGANGGHAHIWSLGLEPVVDLFPKSRNSIYVTGGGGFYRKVTSFTDPEEAEYCEYYYCGITTENVVVGHFSSNQGGWNVGAGFTRRIGGTYNDSKMRLFAEARYLDVNTPAVESSPNGLGTTTVAAGTKVIPVSLGVRW